jgi:hypothetical protein
MFLILKGSIILLKLKWMTSLLLNLKILLMPLIIILNPFQHIQSDRLFSSAAEVGKVIKRLNASECVGLDDIPSFIILPSLWKQTAIVSVFKK